MIGKDIITLFYHYLLKIGRIKKEVPIIVRIVLYIGDIKWNKMEFIRAVKQINKSENL